MTSEKAPPVKRSRGPSQQITQRVFSAVLALLHELGYSNLSMEAIAERSGVHKTTLYRRWGSVVPLVKDAIANVDMGEMAFQDTSSLRGDMLNLAQQFALHFRKPEIIAINQVIAGSKDKELENLMAEYWLERNSLFTDIIERAVNRGEKVIVENFNLSMETMVGAMLLRVLMTRQTIDDEWVEELGRVAYQILISDR